MKHETGGQGDGIGHCSSCGGDGIDFAVKDETGRVAGGERVMPCRTCLGTGYRRLVPEHAGPRELLVDLLGYLLRHEGAMSAIYTPPGGELPAETAKLRSAIRDAFDWSMFDRGEARSE